MTSSLTARLLAARDTRPDYSPSAWTRYFDEAHDVQVGAQDSFRVYLRNFGPPYAPDRPKGERLDASKTELSHEELERWTQIPTLVTLHGAGYSALTWAQFTRYIEQFCKCRVLAIDLRGHGDTKTSDDDQMDSQTLVSDVSKVIHETHKSICGFPETPKVIIIGHSMGGAIAVKCAATSSSLLPTLDGIVVIDVVEGTAKDALPSMMSVIRSRPRRFSSLSFAIQWNVMSGMAKNREAARVSMPGNLLNISNGTLAIHDIESGNQTLKDRLLKHKFHIKLENLIAQYKDHQTVTSLPQGLPIPSRVADLRSGAPSSFMRHPPIEENVGRKAEKRESSNKSKDERNGDGYKKPPQLDLTGYCWRTDLAKTQPYWHDWFDGLSQQLLDAPIQGKFLLLAGIDRLDKILTIGQMQGKFMMKVLPKCGHAVHEDLPQQVATEIAQFLVRNKFTTSLKEEE